MSKFDSLIDLKMEALASPEANAVRTGATPAQTPANVPVAATAQTQATPNAVPVAQQAAPTAANAPQTAPPANPLATALGSLKYDNPNDAVNSLNNAIGSIVKTNPNASKFFGQLAFNPSTNTYSYVQAAPANTNTTQK